ncbi:hypothetical protein NLI96_g4225 [Meripilus lineatus]|uniref:Uncharacterized protein n=1 Tax=Meripilus lineatus TaxID=2056292 RepID=A0AAD5V7B2_9APHY|nr:hypothetical protein NLI96_g4225 [Physisporinus lineatus]
MTEAELVYPDPESASASLDGNAPPLFYKWDGVSLDIRLSALVKFEWYILFFRRIDSPIRVLTSVSPSRSSLYDTATAQLTSSDSTQVCWYDAATSQATNDPGDPRQFVIDRVHELESFQEIFSHPLYISNVPLAPHEALCPCCGNETPSVTFLFLGQIAGGCIGASVSTAGQLGDACMTLRVRPFRRQDCILASHLANYSSDIVGSIKEMLEEGIPFTDCEAGTNPRPHRFINDYLTGLVEKDDIVVIEGSLQTVSNGGEDRSIFQISNIHTLNISIV